VTTLELDQLLGALPQLDAARVFLTLLLALGLGLTVALTYRFSVPERVLSSTMLTSLVLLAMVGSIVMMVIGNNIARAFSLVGALAIIRFRTRLRSAWDISVVFLSLVEGIACGVQAYQVAVLSTVTVTLTVLALKLVPLSGLREDRIRMVRCDVTSFDGVEQELEQTMDRYLLRRWLIEARSIRFGEAISLRYRVAVREPDSIGVMLRDVAQIEGVERVVVDLGEEGPNRSE